MYLPSITTISKRSRRRLLADILYKGDLLSILWTIVVGHMKNILSSSPSPPTCNQIKQNYIKYRIFVKIVMHYQFTDNTFWCSLIKKTITKIISYHKIIEKWKYLPALKSYHGLLTFSLTLSSVWKNGRCSPSLVTLCLISWALTWASMIWLFLMSPTLNMRQGTPSRWLITAFLENIKVWVRFLGRDNLANTTPTMNAWIITPEKT